MIKFSSIALVASVVLAGCSTVAERTNFLSEEQMLSQSAGALGFAPSDLTITSHRTEGTNTYVDLKAKNKKEFTCIINGGNLLSMGMTNPPSCGKKGDRISTGPFGN